VEAIVIHELAHIRRWDYLANLAQSVVEGLLFYHPAVWWIGTVMRTERELCCDDTVIEISGDPRGYAAALATLEEIRCASREPALAAGGGILMQRIRRILNKPDSRSPIGPVLCAGVMLLAAVAISGAWPQEPAAPPAPQAKPQPAAPAQTPKPVVPPAVRVRRPAAKKSPPSPAAASVPQAAPAPVAQPSPARAELPAAEPVAPVREPAPFSATELPSASGAGGRFFVQGEVRRPGLYVLDTPTRVLEALVTAGGFNEYANQKRVLVLRGRERFDFNYKDVIRDKRTEQNIYLEPGDLIVVK